MTHTDTVFVYIYLLELISINLLKVVFWNIFLSSGEILQLEFYSGGQIRGSFH